MDTKSFVTLEFDKILARLAEFTQNEPVRDRILSLTPTPVLQEAQALQQDTADGVAMILRRGNPPGLRVKNVTPSLLRAERGGSLSMQELLSVSSLCKTARALKRYLEDDKALEGGTIFGFVSGLEPLKAVSDKIDDAIVNEEEMADGASPTLYQIRRKKKSLAGKIRDTLQEMITSPKYQKALQDPIITMRGERYVHDYSASGATLFVEPMAVVTITNALAALEAEEKDEISRILAELSAFVSEHQSELTANLTAIYELDFIFAKAKLSLAQNAVEPELNDDGIVNIQKGRHPLLDPKRLWRWTFIWVRILTRLLLPAPIRAVKPSR